ncbi:cytochrome P450 [Syncephalis plumigaleata]|nr:cytochrome P450 [Syncephalis plumigaleata]
MTSTNLVSLLTSAPWWRIGALATLLYIIDRIIKYEFTNPLRKLPGPRSSIVAIFNITFRRMFIKDPYMVVAIHKKYGPIVRTGPTTVWISDIHMVRKIQGSHQYGKSEIFDAFKLVGDNLFATRNVEYHKMQKRLMLPAFSPSALDKLEPMIYDSGVTRLIERVGKRADAGEYVDLMQLLNYMTFDVIGEVAFGRSFNLLAESDDHVSIVEWMNATISLGFRKLLMGRLFHTSLSYEKARLTDELLKFAKDTIENRRKSGNTDRMDTLQQLINAVDDETGATMSDQDLISQAIILMIAGTDTTALTITWTMHLLIEHPECMERLRDEIATIYPDISVNATHDAVQSLPYLDAVIRESLRLRAIVPFGMSRTIPKDGITLGGHFLPATTVSSSLNAIHYNEKVYPEPELFKPDRWFTTPEKLNEMKHHFIPFSIGPRACIGRSLAWMEIRLAVVELVRNFKFTASSKNDMRPVVWFTVRPNGNKLMVKPERV